MAIFWGFEWFSWFLPIQEFAVTHRGTSYLDLVCGGAVMRGGRKGWLFERAKSTLSTKTEFFEILDVSKRLSVPFFLSLSQSHL